MEKQSELSYLFHLPGDSFHSNVSIFLDLK